MKTDFEARPIFLQNETRIKAHFLTCFISLVIYRYLEKALGGSCTCETILSTLKSMNFACVQEQGFMPLYTRDKLTDKFHEICGFRTDYEFITKKDMKTIQKKVKVENKLPYFKTKSKHLASIVNTGIARCYTLINCQRWDFITLRPNILS